MVTHNIYIQKWGCPIAWGLQKLPSRDCKRLSKNFWRHGSRSLQELSPVPSRGCPRGSHDLSSRDGPRGLQEELSSYYCSKGLKEKLPSGCCRRLCKRFTITIFRYSKRFMRRNTLKRLSRSLQELPLVPSRDCPRGSQELCSRGCPSGSKALFRRLSKMFTRIITFKRFTRRTTFKMLSTRITKRITFKRLSKMLTKRIAFKTLSKVHKNCLQELV